MMQSAPGVLAVGINMGLPPVYNWSFPVVAVGSPQQENRAVLMQQTNAEYPRVMGLSVLSGRFLSEAEVNARTHSIAVNQALVRRYFPAGDAIGRLIRIPRLRTTPFNVADDSFQSTGVVNDVVNNVSTNERLPEMYLPYTILGRPTASRARRGDRKRCSGVEGAGLRGRPRAAAHGRQVDGAVLGESAYARPRFNLLLFAVFCGAGNGRWLCSESTA
jgi:hypothetical protein